MKKSRLPGRRGHRRSGEAGRGSSEPWVLEVSEQASAAGDAWDTSGSTGFTNSCGSTMDAQIALPSGDCQSERECPAIRASPSGHRLVGRLYERCPDLWSSLSAVQRRGRLQPRSAARRNRHLHYLGAASSHLRASTEPAKAPASATHWQTTGRRFSARRSRNGPNPRTWRSNTCSREGRTRTPIFERFNRTFRDELLDQHLFICLEDVREPVYWWILEYNEDRPHDCSAISRRSSTLTPPETLPPAQPMGSAIGCARLRIIIATPVAPA